MRILQVNKYNYIRGGAEKYFIEISRELKELGHQVAIFSMKHPKNIPSDFDKYFVSRISFNEGGFKNKIIAPFRVLFSFEARRKFKRLVKDFKPDIIHIHNIYHQISPSILRVAKKRKIPVIMHLHDYKLLCPNYQLLANNKICYRCLGGKYYNCLQQRCFKNSFWKSFLATIEMYLHHRLLKIYKKNIDLFIAPSQFMKDTVVKFAWPENKIKVLYNFSEKLQNDSVNNLDDCGLYFGRLSKEKGIDILLSALNLANKKISLKIIGSGPEESNLKKMVKDLKLESRVKFLGPKFREELFLEVKKAQFVFIPSIWLENMPLTLLEAMMLKKVVIASNTGGLPELVRDGQTGFLFNRGDSQDLARVIDSLDQYNLLQIGIQANLLAEDLSVGRHLSKLLQIYRNY
ncbi:MAG: glycosyltransferase [Patescibacteria group bacterium]|nr:glycosyltransferase [Patescibacteria group bacterium]